MEEVKGAITEIDMFRINRGREKLCRCKNPHYEVDVTNRIVICTDCGAVVDSFDALMTLCKKYEVYQQDIKRLKSRAEVYAEEANKEFSKMCRGKIFREMEREYRNNMLPTCPECGHCFDPVNINSWTNRAVADNQSARRSREEKP